MQPPVFIHIDIDSPATLLRFWGLNHVRFEDHDLDAFYACAMERALGLLDECSVPATFFCVGKELEKSSSAARMTVQASRAGHEIANHTHSHPYGFVGLSEAEIRQEIDACSQVIRKITGRAPVGFRAPSYDVNGRVLDVLESLAFQYDSSVFYSILNPWLKLYHRMLRKKDASDGFGTDNRPAPARPYFPSVHDFKSEGTGHRLLEIPMPVSNFLQLPFYNNFHLSAGELYRQIALRGMGKDSFPYLFHLIEFCDLNDGVPEPLKVHPNLKMDVRRKLKIAKDSITFFKRRYKIMRTDEFATLFKHRGKD